VIAERAMRAVGFDHGAFNIELYWEPSTSRFRIVEINPRLAAQFGDLYHKVDGTHPHSVLSDLSVGRTPHYVRGRGRFAAAASFVLREFDGAVKIAPSRAQIRWLGDRYPEARLQTFIKHGNSRWRETKWLGSYRYAIVNLGGTSREDLEHRFADVCRHVRFERSERVRFEPQRFPVGRASARRDIAQGSEASPTSRRAHGTVIPMVNSAALAPSSTNSPQ
jgi:hypothetical protein